MSTDKRTIKQWWRKITNAYLKTLHLNFKYWQPWNIWHKDSIISTLTTRAELKAFCDKAEIFLITSEEARSALEKLSCLKLKIMFLCIQSLRLKNIKLYLSCIAVDTAYETSRGSSRWCLEGENETACSKQVLYPHLHSEYLFQFLLLSDCAT